MENFVAVKYFKFKILESLWNPTLAISWCFNRIHNHSYPGSHKTILNIPTNTIKILQSTDNYTYPGNQKDFYTDPYSSVLSRSIADQTHYVYMLGLGVVGIFLYGIVSLVNGWVLTLKLSYLVLSVC